MGRMLRFAQSFGNLQPSQLPNKSPDRFRDSAHPLVSSLQFSQSRAGPLGLYSFVEESKITKSYSLMKVLIHTFKQISRRFSTIHKGA